MFGAYFEVKKMEEEVAKKINALRNAYRALESVDRQNPLLALAKVEDSTKKSGYPYICPVLVNITLTPEFVNKYKERGPSEKYTIFEAASVAEFGGGLEKYIVDLEKEIDKLKQK